MQAVRKRISIIKKKDYWARTLRDGIPVDILSLINVGLKNHVIRAVHRHNPRRKNHLPQALMTNHSTRCTANQDVRMNLMMQEITEIILRNML